MKKTINLLLAGGLTSFLLNAAELPKPVFYENMDTLKTETGDAALNTPSKLDAGKTGDAVLLERRTENLFAEATLPAKDSKVWILLTGAAWESYDGDEKEIEGQVVLPAGGIVRQRVEGLKEGKLYCFSTHLYPVKGGSGKVSMEWSGSEESNAREFEVPKEGKRCWVWGRCLGGSAVATLKCVAGKVKMDRPQFERGSTFPTSFVAKGPRGVSGLIWKGAAPLFNANQGAVSFWIKPLWGAGEMSDDGQSLFAIRKDPEENWKTAHSAITLGAWLLDPKHQDWQYALTLMINDKNVVQHQLSAPLHDFKGETWHHVAVSWDLSQKGKSWVALYVDGEETTRADQLALEGMDGISHVAFGRHLGGYLDGWLDEVRIFDRALDKNAIAELRK
ncbi:MAG: LamG domain-containing protein [Verrucomicrobia bacterium]|nr:LamG domain-containing protein [Verrucomicrobiota bacterium]